MVSEMLKNRWVLLVETILAAGLLFGLGYETAESLWSGRLEKCQERTLQQAKRAAELQRDKLRLEQRLAAALAQAGQPPRRLAAAEAPPPANTGGEQGVFRVLHRDRADLWLGGRLVVSLEQVAGGHPRVALLRIKVAGGQEGRKALKAGQEVRIRVDGRVYRLLVKQIYTASLRYGLLPAR